MTTAVGCDGASAPDANASKAPARWTAIANEIAGAWPRLQGANGHFRDYVKRRAPSRIRDDYGDALLGYGLLQRAASTGDTKLRDAGLEAIRYALRSRGHTAVAPFRYVGIASAYNLARRRFSTAPLFKSTRTRWQRVIRGLKIRRVGRSEVTNKSLVEAVEILEVTRTGLRSSKRGTILHDRQAAIRRVKRLLGRDLPHTAARFERRDRRAGRTAMIGDFTALPPAYHALASGFLARAITLMGRSAPTPARHLLHRAVDASWALAGPDGDVSYWGRSQEQAWTLPLTAYAAKTAAHLPEGDRRAPRYYALANRVIDRLDHAYGVGPEGFLVTPALKRDIDAGIRGLDPYVAAVSYNGMTLVALNWAIAEPGGVAKPSHLGADTGGSFRLGTGAPTFATVRRGNVWFAVKQAKTAKDLRYDFGLVAMKVRAQDGNWRDALPLRPRVERESETAGPVLRRHGDRGMSEGRSLSVSGNGSVTVAGGFRNASGRWLRRRVSFRFTPTSCGVRLRTPARAGDALDYSGFFRARPSTTVTSVTGGGQKLTFRPKASVSLKRGFASDLDPRLTRARLRFAHATRAGLSIITCAG